MRQFKTCYIYKDYRIVFFSEYSMLCISITNVCRVIFAEEFKPITNVDSLILMLRSGVSSLGLLIRHIKSVTI